MTPIRVTHVLFIGVGAGHGRAHAGTAEPLDRLAVAVLGGLTLTQQGARARLGAKRPAGAAGAGRLGKPLESVGCARGLAACRLPLVQAIHTSVNTAVNSPSPRHVRCPARWRAAWATTTTTARSQKSSSGPTTRSRGCAP